MSGVTVTDGSSDDRERAQSDGIYTDADGLRHYVAAGDPIPDGWEHAEDAEALESPAVKRSREAEEERAKESEESTSSSSSSTSSKARKSAPEDKSGS